MVNYFNFNTRNKLIYSVFFIQLLSLLTIEKSNAQELPKIFVEDFSNAIRSVIVSGYDSIDIYTVAVKLSPEGELMDIFFSTSATESLKKLIKRRLAIADIDHIPIKDYWKEYCKKKQIAKPVILIQPVFTRSKNTDNLKIDISEMTNKYRTAFSFAAEKASSLGEGLVIWLPIKFSRFDIDVHID